jgi:hypothetical protein
MATSDRSATTPDPFSAAFTAWLQQPWRWWGLAPQQLTQPINSGWSFGNLIVNNANSSAPEVEQAVVSRHSYGRQIGRMMEALLAIVQVTPSLAQDPRVKSLVALAQDVERIKQATAEERLDHLREELEALKANNPEAWRRLAALFR